VHTAECRRHGRVSHFAWRSSGAAADDERVTDHNRVSTVRARESALLESPVLRIDIQADS